MKPLVTVTLPKALVLVEILGKPSNLPLSLKTNRIEVFTGNLQGILICFYSELDMRLIF